MSGSPAAVLVRALIERGYENYSCLKWRHKETGIRLSRNDLSTMCHRILPEADPTYLRSERFFNHLSYEAAKYKS